MYGEIMPIYSEQCAMYRTIGIVYMCVCKCARVGTLG